MCSRKKFLLFFILVIVVSWLNTAFLWAYPWPVSPFAGSHPISGTLGEWRDNPPHLHKGVDIARSGVSVYPVEDETIYKEDIGESSIRVGNFKYIHITLNEEIKTWFTLYPDEGYPAITSETNLGIISGDHLHLEENDGASNPLREDGLDDYTDGARTYVSSVEIYRQGTGTQLAGAVWGDADILSLAWDSQNSISNKVSVYRIAYRVKNTDDEDVVGPIENIQFDDIVNASRGLVYANFEDRQSTRSDYYYWVTNTPWEDDYWMTNQSAVGEWRESVRRQHIVDQQAFFLSDGI